MEIEKNDISSLLYNSLKDVLYNKDCIYVYCNFKIEDIDNILKEMLDTKILDKDGYVNHFTKVEWENIENYYMLNTIETNVTLKFIKDEIISNNLDKEFKIFINESYENKELHYTLLDIYKDLPVNIKIILN